MAGSSSGTPSLAPLNAEFTEFPKAAPGGNAFWGDEGYVDTPHCDGKAEKHASPNHGDVLHTDWNSRFASRYTPQAKQVATAYETWQADTGHALLTVYGSNGQVIFTQRF